MAEIGHIGGPPVSPPDRTQAGERTVGQIQPGTAHPPAVESPVGPPGPLGQPTGLPAPPGQTRLLPDALTGRDPSQLVAAERMRQAGGASATEALLGLTWQPSVLGAIAPPPGNSQALRHMTPTMRRTLMRLLLTQQRERVRRLAQLLGRDPHEGRDESSDESEGEPLADPLALIGGPVEEVHRQRAAVELAAAARMLDLLDELLALQDYTFSQMGTFSQG